MILTKDDLFNMVKERIGDDTSETSLSFIENLTDTYNDLVQKASGDGVDWKAKYEENDNAWKQRYKERFFDNSSTSDDSLRGKEGPAKKLTFESLFT